LGGCRSNTARSLSLQAYEEEDREIADVRDTPQSGFVCEKAGIYSTDFQER
jgi:hypothetical protein